MATKKPKAKGATLQPKIKTPHQISIDRMVRNGIEQDVAEMLNRNTPDVPFLVYIPVKIVADRYGDIPDWYDIPIMFWHIRLTEREHETLQVLFNEHGEAGFIQWMEPLGGIWLTHKRIIVPEVSAQTMLEELSRLSGLDWIYLAVQ